MNSVDGSLFALLGKDLIQFNGLGPYLALKLIAECGDDLSAWPSAKHFTSRLCLAPSNKVSGGKVLSSRTRRSGSRAAALLPLAADLDHPEQRSASGPSRNTQGELVRSGGCERAARSAVWARAIRVTTLSGPKRRFLEPRCHSIRSTLTGPE
jgi:transposase